MSSLEWKLLIDLHCNSCPHTFQSISRLTRWNVCWFESYWLKVTLYIFAYRNDTQKELQIKAKQSYAIAYVCVSLWSEIILGAGHSIPGHNLPIQKKRGNYEIKYEISGKLFKIESVISSRGNYDRIDWEIMSGDAMTGSHNFVLWFATHLSVVSVRENIKSYF